MSAHNVMKNVCLGKESIRKVLTMFFIQDKI